MITKAYINTILLQHKRIPDFPVSGGLAVQFSCAVLLLTAGRVKGAAHSQEAGALVY